MKRTAACWIRRLQLKSHPEGGYYRQTYRAPGTIARSHLPKRYKGQRAFATAIYFLLRGRQFSAFHRLKSDEIWHFYDGEALSIFVIGNAGRLTTARLGLNAERGEQPQVVIRAGAWFAARLNKANSFALIGCTVAPGFDFADFELGNRRKLCRKFPKHRALIERLTFK